MALSAGSVEIRLFAELARLQSDMKKANKVVEDAMGGIQKTVRGAATVFNNLAGAFGAAQLVKLADDYKRFDAQLRLSTKSLGEYEQAYANVIRIGRTAQSDINAIGVLYSRLNNNLRDFNVTQREVSDVTETISLALRVNNATVQETNSTMLQLSQSFGSGKLNGQEFLAVAEGAPALLRQVAKQLNVNYGALRDMSAQGQITREILLKAWTDPEYLAGLREQVKEVGTITSSFTVLTNNLKQYIGETDKATGSSKSIAGVIRLVADNINFLVTGALAYGIGRFVKWSEVQIAAMNASKARAAQEVITANITQQAAIREANVLQTKIGLQQLELTTKVRLQEARVLDAQKSVIAAANTAKEAAAIAALEKQTLLLAKAKLALATANGTVGVSMANNAAAVTKMSHDIVTTTAKVGLMTTAFNGLKYVLAAFGGWIGVAITAVILFGDKIVALIDKARGLTPELKRINEQIERNNQLRGIGVAPDDPNASQRSEVAATVKELARLQEMRDRVQRMGKGAGLYMMFSTPAEKIAEIDAQIAQGRKNIANALKDISFNTDMAKDKGNQASEAYLELSKKLVTAKEKAAEYAANQKLISDELAKGTITQAEANAKLAVLAEQYAKSTGALKANKEAIKAEIDENVRRLNVAIWVNEQIYANEKATRDAIDEERKERIAEAVEKQKQFNAEVERIKDAVDPTRAYTRQIERLAEMFNAGRITAEEFAKASEMAQTDMLSFAEASRDGLQELRDAVDGYSKDMSRSMADWMTGAETDFGDMINSMLKNLLVLANQKLIFDPLFKAFGETDFASSIGNFIGSIIPNANGGVYSGAGISSYSSSIVDKPTVFPFAKGIGLMGEAGAEAIMPLTRGADGKLGVSAVGGGGNNVTINVIEAQGTRANVEQQQNPDGSMSIKVIVEQLYSVMNRDLQRGSGIAPTLERRYGLNRMAGA